MSGVIHGVGADQSVRALGSPGRISLTTLRASSALGAAGAVATVPATAFAIPLGVTRLSVLVTVTRAHAGGKVKLVPYWTCGGAGGVDETALDAEDGDSTLPLISNPVSVTPPDGSATSRLLLLEVPPGYDGLQLKINEIGSDLNQPSTVAASVTGGY